MRCVDLLDAADPPILAGRASNRSTGINARNTRHESRNLCLRELCDFPRDVCAPVSVCVYATTRPRRNSDSPGRLAPRSAGCPKQGCSPCPHLLQASKYLRGGGSLHGDQPSASIDEIISIGSRHSDSPAAQAGAPHQNRSLWALDVNDMPLSPMSRNLHTVGTELPQNAQMLSMHSVLPTPERPSACRPVELLSFLASGRLPSLRSRPSGEIEGP